MIKIKHTYLKQFLIGLFGALMFGCVSSKKTTYFQDKDGQILKETLINYEPMLQIGDILTINVATTEAEAALPFNLYEAQGVANLVPLPHIINADGEINFPVIGKIKVAQLTTKQLANELTEKLLPYLKKPIVNIRLTNFKVTILGEVNSPGNYPVLNERISIIEAIGLAGDLTIYGKRKTVTLIREQDGKRIFIPIDLTNKELFDSPYFYLAQNDVIYVEANRTKVNSSGVGPNTSILVSSFSVLMTLVAILVR